MRVYLVDAYRQLCYQQNRRPLASLEASLGRLYTAQDGETFIDATEAASNEHFSLVLDLVQDLLANPCKYVGQPLAATHSPLAAMWLRVKVRLPRCADNARVQKLCSMIPVARDPALGLDHGPLTSSVQSGAIETIDATGCVHVSLAGGRAMRAAARRNIFLKYVFVSGCSINRGTVRQLQRATAFNRAFHAADTRACSGSAAAWLLANITPPRTPPHERCCPATVHRTARALPFTLCASPVPTPSPISALQGAKGSSERPSRSTSREPFWEALSELLPSIRRQNSGEGSPPCSSSGLFSTGTSPDARR